MWYQFWPPSARAIRAVLAVWRRWLIILIVVTVFASNPVSDWHISQLFDELQRRDLLKPRFRTALFWFEQLAISSPLWIILAVLLTTCVFLWMGFSRGLPHHLRVFGKFEDPNPWVYDSDASTFAEDLVTTPGEVDNDTGVEIVRVTGNIIEPGEPGMLFFRRPIRCTWDNIAVAGTGGAYGIQHQMRVFSF